jgi:hypothetical protein
MAGNTPVLVHNCNNATVHWDSDQGHSVIEVQNGGEMTRTDLILENLGPGTKVRDISARSDRGGLSNDAVHPVLFDLPNPAAAAEYQKLAVGRGGPFSYEDNSCLTHCARVLRAGGHPEFQGTDAEITDILIGKLPAGTYDWSNRG